MIAKKLLGIYYALGKIEIKNMFKPLEPINWYGTYILTRRESARFLRVYNQTIIAPGVSALVFLLIFILAIGHLTKEIGGVSFINFIGYGLIIMSIIQNAFSNSISSLIMSKVIGYVSDILMPPLGGIEVAIALCLGSLLRGLVVGAVVTMFLLPFVEFKVHHPLTLVFFTVISCLLMSMLGILSGIIANSFDQYGAISSYIITPLSFLSGTFYSSKSLPGILQTINLFNPFFYIIDGFRYSLTNYADSNITTGFIVLSLASLGLFYLVVKLLDAGWRIKV